jgi:AcrR family transcriptional regulator
MGTKSKILDAALKLFNESNTQAATTNHIAATAGISPGNLHYHFKNREEIIRRLYEKMRSEFTLTPDTYPTSAADLVRVHEHTFEIQWKYRFFYRELLFLLSRDAKLKAIYQGDTRAQKERIAIILRGLEEKGVLLLPYDNVIDYLIDMILLVEQFWNSYMQLCDAGDTSAAIRTGILRIEETLRPFLSDEARKALGEMEK